MPGAHVGAAARLSQFRDGSGDFLWHRNSWAPYSGLHLKASIRSPFLDRAQSAFPRRNWRRASERELSRWTSTKSVCSAKTLGADVLVNVNATANVVEAIRDVTHGLGADLALDASGAASARRIAEILHRATAEILRN